MRLAVISDIHGNRPALEAVEADIAQLGADATINLGDLVSGPVDPVGTISARITNPITLDYTVKYTFVLR